MAVYIDTVLLPKHVIDSFYATWLHCYEELFEASLSFRSTSFKFDWSSTLSRKDPEKLNIEKAEQRGATFDGDTKGSYIQKEITDSEIEHEHQVKAFTLNQDGLVRNFQQNGSRTAYTATKLFTGRKRIYRITENDDL